MRTLHSFLLPLAGVLLLAAAGPSLAQTAATSANQLSPQSQADLKAIAALVSEIQAQQKTLVENQTQIDQRIATLTETIRVARIWSKRGGGASGSK